jgi:hypothetical protein
MLVTILFFLAGCGRREERSEFDAPQRQASSSAAGTAAAPLPPSALHVRWGKAEGIPATIPAGTQVDVTVAITNAGNGTWPDRMMGDPQKKDGGYAVRVGYSWRHTDRGVRQRAGTRVDLSQPLPPGQTAAVKIPVIAPADPGDYELSLELVQELVVWFADAGADTLNIPVSVTAPAASPAAR